MTQHRQRTADIFTATLRDMPGSAIGGATTNRMFIARQGAQVLSWRDGSGVERLYLSSASGGFRRGGQAGAPAAPGASEATNAGKAAALPAIRGGVPVCFPQFSGRGNLPKHGLVRTMLWSPAPDAAAEANANADFNAGVSTDAAAGPYHCVTLTCRDDAATRHHWPQRFTAAVTAGVAQDRLHVALEVRNTGDEAWEFTVALHTYFAIRDIAGMRLRGLQGISYQDATDNNRLCVQAETDLRIDAELDRVYIAPPSPLLLLQQGIAPLRIEQYGFMDSVVWNPGPQKAASLPDFPDDDWRRMVCVEAACAMQPVRLAPGECWRAGQIMTVMPPIE